MARKLTSGAESGHLLPEGLIGFGSTVSVSSTKARTGTYSVKLDSGAGGTACDFSRLSAVAVPDAATTIYARGYLLFDNLPASTVKVSSILSAAGTKLVNARLTSAGKLQLWNDVAETQIGSDSSETIAADGTTWHRIELYFTNGGTNLDACELRLNGTTVASTSGVEISTASAFFAEWGWSDAPGANRVMYVDDVGYNDGAAGTGSTSWLGDARVINLFPVSDNARSTEWTGGAGGTTNLFDAVDNRPPVGTATETNTTQIEHAGGATGSYDANMTSYTTAGIGASDTITVVQLATIHGEDIATGAKLLAFSVVSNPAIASSGNYTVGDSTPTDLGTFPTEWGVALSNMSHSPSVTLGTSPVARINRPETASRVASVCYVAMVVEYVPASGTPATMTVTAATASAAGEAVTLNAASNLTVTAATAPAAGGTVGLNVPNALTVTAATAPAAGGTVNLSAAAALTVTAATAPAAGGAVNLAAAAAAALEAGTATAAATASSAMTGAAALSVTVATSPAAAAGALAAASALTAGTATAPAAGGTVTLTAASKLTLDAATAIAEAGTVGLNGGTSISGTLTVAAATAPAAGETVALIAASVFSVVPAFAPAAGGGIILTAAAVFGSAPAPAFAAGGDVILDAGTPYDPAADAHYAVGGLIERPPSVTAVLIIRPATISGELADRPASVSGALSQRTEAIIGSLTGRPAATTGALIERPLAIAGTLKER